MEELYVSQDTLYEVVYGTVLKASQGIPSDVWQALKRAYGEEKDELAKLHLKRSLDSIKLGQQLDRFAGCADTGWPLFFVRMGDNVRIENGFSSLYDVCTQVVIEATRESRLRETMCHPLTRQNLGNNIGSYIPSVDIKFDSVIDCMEVTFVPKGGGAEIFGTFFQMMFPGDGRQGIMKFILECASKSTYAGGTCPPNILGIGVGGTADICMKIAKEAAVLRPVGSRHSDPEIAQMELDLLEAINMLERGPMGTGGTMTLLDVHIEYAATHTAALAVGFSSQCALAKRATAKLGKDGRIEYTDFPFKEYHGKVGKGV